MSISEQLNRNDRKIDAAISDFEIALSRIILNAQSDLVSSLSDRLDIEDGVLKSTSRNVRVIDNLGASFVSSMNSNGYRELVEQFTSSFGIQIQSFERILESVVKKLGIDAKLTKLNASYFDGIKSATQTSLIEVVSVSAQQARVNALMSVNGLPMKSLSNILTSRLNVARADARTIAATGISTFYRTVADTGYKQIEENLQGTDVEIRYVYMGPPSGDRLIRPFCSRLMARSAQGISFTRAQIDAMDSGQMPNTFVTCGGFNCRHQWAVAIEGDNYAD